MKNNRTVLNRTQKIEQLHWHIQHWKSDLQYMEDETDFVERLLNSEIFEPNRPNLFERLNDYLKKLGIFKSRKTKLQKLISIHENLLGTVMESDDDRVVTNFYLKHDDLEMEVLSCTDDFKKLKMEIFNFVGSTLKVGTANLE